MNPPNGNLNGSFAVTSLYEPLKYIDLFCGIGGFRIAAEPLGWKCVFSSDIDEECQRAYEANFGERPFGDIHQIQPDDVPDHDILFGGFPCQPFSIIGDRKGFDDTRGTLFFEIARLLEAKKPRAFVLENVKLLAGHNGGRTIARITEVLRELGYDTRYKVLNALNFGLPQKRERVFIVGSLNGLSHFQFPMGGVPMKPLSELLEADVPKKFYASEHIVRQRQEAHPKPHPSPAIWHENKGGHISSYPFSCALRAGASYNYLLVDGIRRLTPREMLRLQGFPDTYKIVCSDGEARKQAGNSVPVPMVRAVLYQLAKALAAQNLEAANEYSRAKAAPSPASYKQLEFAISLDQ
ncbi:MAG TPA: DNA (cytosine-5-)-methyltransferase [Chloroflexia bacterium]|jgi:DNA (cytosine-5)-methyltransferase 1